MSKMVLQIVNKSRVINIQNTDLMILIELTYF
jgi:hypothetical protein